MKIFEPAVSGRRVRICARTAEGKNEPWEQSGLENGEWERITSAEAPVEACRDIPPFWFLREHENQRK